MKITPMFAWYDFWIGLFWDTTKHRLYVFPVPCLGVRIDFSKRMPVTSSPTDLEAANRDYAERTCRKRLQHGWKEGVIEKVVQSPSGILKAKVLWDGASPTYEDLLDLTIS